ncbi:MAG: ribonuclease III [Acidimicrobiia bacterium]
MTRSSASPPHIDFESLAGLLEVTIRDEALFTEALAHRSYCSEHSTTQNNERLEFLGDSVLGLAVTNFIFATYPTLSEGQLAKVRSAVVSADALAEVARELGIGAHLLLGKGEAASNGAEKTSILSDAMESLIAAIYLQDGFLGAESFILRVLGDRVVTAAAGPGGHDYKTQLQEQAARMFKAAPKYRLVEQGPDHDKEFTATVSVAGRELGAGTGPSKKVAEQAAAKAAWDVLAADESEPHGPN